MSSAAPMPPRGLRVEYRIALADHRVESLEVDVVEAPRGARPLVSATTPPWAALGFHQCPHCPLDAATTPDCPLAVRLAPALSRFSDVESIAPVSITVRTDIRTVSGETTAQHAIGSLLGLLMATSDCPYTEFLRPMARFHLPLASVEETCYRVVSMHALGLAFRARRGEQVRFDFAELFENYARLETLNHAFAARIRAASAADGTRNAIVMLDALAKLVPTFLEDTLRDLERLFRGHLGGLSTKDA